MIVIDISAHLGSLQNNAPRARVEDRDGGLADDATDSIPKPSDPVNGGRAGRRGRLSTSAESTSAVRERDPATDRPALVSGTGFATLPGAEIASREILYLDVTSGSTVTHLSCALGPVEQFTTQGADGLRVWVLAHDARADAATNARMAVAACEGLTLHGEPSTRFPIPRLILSSLLHAACHAVPVAE